MCLLTGIVRKGVGHKDYVSLIRESLCHRITHEASLPFPVVSIEYRQCHGNSDVELVAIPGGTVHDLYLVAPCESLQSGGIVDGDSSLKACEP